MANKSVFSTAPRPDTVNEAGGKAFSLSDRQALAQIAATNCFNGTYYSDEDALLKVTQDTVDRLVIAGDFEFLGQVAVYARQKGFMKDMPAFLVAVLACHNAPCFRTVFKRVIDNGRMLRNFVQIGRSGAAGKKLNMSARRIRSVIQDWFTRRSNEQLFRDSVGNDPSLADVIKMARPRPEDEVRNSLYQYLIGRDYSIDFLPDIVKSYERFKETRQGEVPDVEFRLLDSLNLTKDEWTQVAIRAPWHMTRMNLNTFQRHGVFEDAYVAKSVADRLRNPEMIQKAKVFPYQLMVAYAMTAGVPTTVRNALQDAMEVATENVPKILGRVCVAVDVSGSMQSAVTGNRGTATTTVRCVDVAALFASCILRKNEDSLVLPFDTRIHSAILNPRDTVMTNAHRLAQFGGGGTNCSTVLKYLNQDRKPFDLVVYVSDNESWMDRGGQQAVEWEVYRRRNPNAKLVCIDITPYPTVQTPPSKDVLHVGGFSDTVFTVIDNFARGEGNNGDYWVSEIRKVVV